MDFNSAIKNLRFYLDNQSLLQKITSLEDLEFKTPAVGLLLKSKGNVFHIPDEKLFKKAIIFFDEDPTKITVSKDKPRLTFSKQNSIFSSLSLFDSFINDKMIKSAYWNLFDNYEEINYEDSIIVVKSPPNTESTYNYIIIKGPMNESDKIPEFLNTANLLGVFTYRNTPYTLPPTLELFQTTYRHLKELAQINWDITRITNFLESIWNERSPSTIFSRLSLLFESAIMIVEKSDYFNKFLRISESQKNGLVGIPSNFLLAICGGYARGEYSKTSDLDMLLIHEGNEEQFSQVGEALHRVFQHISTLELCKVENLTNLNFHEDSISDILSAFLEGDESYLDANQKNGVEEMIGSIEKLQHSNLSPEERCDGVRKYCWSIYKSIINMIPIYEKPIGKGEYLRKKITQSTKRSLYNIISLLLRITDSLTENNILGESLRVCEPYVYDSIFKKYSVITALQDLSTIVTILSDSSFTSSTVKRFELAKMKEIITEEQAMKFIKGYQIFSRTKYSLKKEMPIESIELINEDIKKAIIEVYKTTLNHLEPIKHYKEDIKITYPFLVFSDLHWGLNTKLAKQSLVKVKKICEEHKIKTILIAGDILNIDCVNELKESDINAKSLLNELEQIQSLLGDPRIHIISGNHDPQSFYEKFSNKIKKELDIHFIGDHYRDEKIWIEHGDLDFWKNFTPPIDQYINKYRIEKGLTDQKIIVGHTHRIYDEKNLGFYANGSLGKSFSMIIVKKDSIEIIKSPTEHVIDFDRILTEYKGIVNADEIINNYIQNNFELVKGNELTSSMKSSSEKRTWIVTENGKPIGIIPFNRVEEVCHLENIQVYEVAFPIDYIFKLGQTLKESWEIFSVTGASLLPVMNEENQVIGTLSIFSIPKPQKEHSETKTVKNDKKMEEVGDFLTEKMFEKQKKMK